MNLTEYFNTYYLEFYKLKLSLTEKRVSEEEIIEEETREVKGLTKEENKLVKEYEIKTGEGTQITSRSTLEETILRFHEQDVEPDITGDYILKFNYNNGERFYDGLDELTEALNNEKGEIKKRIQEYKTDSTGKGLMNIINKFRIGMIKEKNKERETAVRNEKQYEGLKRLFETIKKYEKEGTNKNKLEGIIKIVDNNINKTKELLRILGYKENEYSRYNKRS